MSDNSSKVAAGREAGFPLWINRVEGIEALPIESTQRSSLLTIRDLFRCDAHNDEECWAHVLLSSYLIDFDWLLAAVPELSAVTGRIVILSGQKGTASVRLSKVEPSPTCTATSLRYDRENLFLKVLPSSATCHGSTARSHVRDRLTVLEPPLPIPFGTHHTKMAICVNRKGVRVAIFTANLLESDWVAKSQGIYMQDFPWRVPGAHRAGAGLGSSGAAPAAAAAETEAFATLSSKDEVTDSPKGTDFCFQLQQYLLQCGLTLTAPYIPGAPIDGQLGIFGVDFLPHIDFSAAAVWLVTSVPGARAHGEARPGYRVGLSRLAEILRRLQSSGNLTSEPIVLSWQYSSQGTLNDKFLHTLRAAMCGEAEATFFTGETPSELNDVQVVYPTEEEVRNSWEGWRGGGALPVSSRTCHPFVNARLHRWGVGETLGDDSVKDAALSFARRQDALDVDELDSEREDEGIAKLSETPASARQRWAAYWRFALPHLKTYAAMSIDRSRLNWFLLTSANLSQAAWGSFGGGGRSRSPQRQLVRSYEVGVLYDGTSVVAPGVHRFSIVADPSHLALPTAQNCGSILFGVSLGSTAELYLPYDILNPSPYASNAALQSSRSAGSDEEPTAGTLTSLDCRDTPWVVDAPHRGRDAYGRTVAEAFAMALPPISQWQPHLGTPSHVTPNTVTRKRFRDL